MTLRTALSAMILVASAASIEAQRESDAKYIAAAKRTSVAQLDPSLPRISLDKWLRQVLGPEPKISWEANDCGEASGSPSDAGRDLPICAEASAVLGSGAKMHISVVVGSMKTGVHGTPSLWGAVIVCADSTESFRYLAALARAIKARQK